MIDSLLSTVVSAASGQVSELIIRSFKDYLKKKGEKLPEKPTEDEVLKSLASIERRESSKSTIADAQSVFGDASNRLANFREERQRQARSSYNLAWLVLGTGSLIILCGIAWMALGNSATPGTVTSAVGVLTSLCSGAIFKFANDANDRLDDIANNLHGIESTRLALSVAEKINNEDERNAAILRLINTLSNVQSSRSRKKPKQRLKR